MQGRRPGRRWGSRTARPFSACPGAAVWWNAPSSAQRKRERAVVGRIIGSGVGGDNNGNSFTSRQVATGSGASNQNNTAEVNGSAFTALHQSNSNVAVNFRRCW
ncbi:hypothetical protein ACFYNW_10790 [Streptomyces virginiae]|uniref:hypothetical protein n=1 Tax=Streptomyces virginiae TaxID=1961 RepID=UPI0033BB4DD2